MDVRKLISAGIAIACAVGVALVGVTPANAAETDPMAAVAAASPDTVANAASVPTTDTGTDAVAAAIAGTDVTVPVDPAAGISLGSGSQVVSIGLPFARNAGDASVQKSGVVSYDNNNGSTTVPVVQRDGNVQINTVIEDASAPKRYDYPISVPAGQHLQLNEDGSASVVTPDGVPSLAVAAPWAKDANGNAVLTHYEVQGSALTQVIDFAATTVFPVVADPSVTWLWWGRTITYNKSETRHMADFTSDAQALSFACAIAGGVAGAAVCGGIAAIGLHIVATAARNAAKAGRCMQLNFPYVGPGLIYDVKC
ncbi:hypothetical protein [Leifsonia soli]|uniref:Uncharacterized protein n=1 Tax=Leifsonia soli TaxID=582665 RepID=A0A852T0D7_9MICO|nr:hypothetical protein [Leifsonia soli]NYD74363.1 hypothetical protein [Leifsonia soli]